MRISIILPLLFLLSSTFMFAQENNAALCSDGIDNDGDGLIDCEDDDCFGNLCLACLDDVVSFADLVLDYSPTCEDDLLDNFNDPEEAIGTPNWDNSGVGTGSVSLGNGGSVTLQFTNNILTNSGSNYPDCWVFEIGPAVEAVFLEFRPFDAFTITALNSAGITDTDGDGFYLFGAIGGATAFIDLDAIVQGYDEGLLVFDAIKIIDDINDNNNPCTNSSGADIDAVCALSSVVILDEICGNGLDDDGDGLIDCDDDDLSSDCCCIDPALMSIEGPSSFCEGESVVLSVGDELGSVLWSTGETTNTISLAVAGPVSVSAIDSCSNVLEASMEIIELSGSQSDLFLSLCAGESELVNDVEYDQGGSFVQSLVNSVSCDSLLNITVVVSDLVQVNSSETLCFGESIMMGGSNFNQTGNYTINISSVTGGCDTVVDFSLEILDQIDRTIISEILCFGDTLIYESQNLSISGSYDFNLMNFNGCDSLVTIDLLVSPQDVSEILLEYCPGESVEYNGVFYAESGVFDELGVNADGCEEVTEITVSKYSDCVNCGSSIPNFLAREITFHKHESFVTISIVNFNSSKVSYDVPTDVLALHLEYLAIESEIQFQSKNPNYSISSHYDLNKSNDSFRSTFRNDKKVKALREDFMKLVEALNVGATGVFSLR